MFSVFFLPYLNMYFYFEKSKNIIPMNDSEYYILYYIILYILHIS